MARSHPYDLLLVDWRLPDISGIDVIRSLCDIEHLRFILMSGFLTVPIAVEAMKLGAADVLEKPLTMEDLLEIASGLVWAPPERRSTVVTRAPRSAPASEETSCHAMLRPGSVAERCDICSTAVRSRSEDRAEAENYGSRSRTGRTSMLPSRAGGIFDATWMASLRSLASIR
jgi:CheY-like chemotaxis protein